MIISEVVSTVLIATFCLIAFANGYCLVRFLASRTGFSVVPFMGGILGCAGFLLSRSLALRHLWWLPLILDFGCLPSLVGWALVLTKKGLRRSSY
jgi:hypothetical protein